MSIKGLLVSKLQDSFGQYIEGLTADNLKMQVWAGVITQENLSLKREALAALNLPISVSAGFLGKFKVSVPWTNLGTQSVVVEIEDVLLVAVPNRGRSKDEDDLARLKILQAAASKKLAKLAEHELARQATLKMEASGGEDAGTLVKLGTKIANNIKVSIKNMHVRFEDVPPPPTPADVRQALTQGGLFYGVSAEKASVCNAEEFVRRLGDNLVPRGSKVWGAGASWDHGWVLLTDLEETELDDVVGKGAEMSDADREELLQQLLDELQVLMAKAMAAPQPADGTEVPSACRPVAVGVKMDELSIETTDDTGKPAFEGSSKAIRLKGFSVYTENPPPSHQLASLALGSEGGAPPPLRGLFQEQLGRLEAGGVCARQFIVATRQDVVLRGKGLGVEGATNALRTELDGLELSWDQRQHEDVNRLMRLFASLQQPPPRLPQCLGYTPSKRKLAAEEGSDSGMLQKEETAIAMLRELEEHEVRRQIEWRDAFRLVAGTSPVDNENFLASSGKSMPLAIDAARLAACLRASNCHDPAPLSTLASQCGEGISEATFLTAMKNWTDSSPDAAAQRLQVLQDRFAVLDAANDETGLIGTEGVRRWLEQADIGEVSEEEVELLVREGQMGGDGMISFAWAVLGLRLVLDRRRYVALWKQKYLGAHTNPKAPVALPEAEAIELKVLGFRMHHNHIMVARNTAEKEAKVHLAKAAKAAKVEQAAKKKKGFFSWGGRDDALPGTMSAEADIVLDEAELAALDAVHPDFAVKYDDDEQALLSKNLWELNLSCSINITLSRKCGQKRVLEMVLPSTTAKIERREFDGSYVATMAMHSLRLVDPQRQETQYSRIVKPLGTASGADRFVDFKFVMKPRTEGVDGKLKPAHFELKLDMSNRIQYVHSPEFISDVKSVFSSGNVAAGGVSTSITVEDLGLQKELNAATAYANAAYAKRKAALARQLAERPTWSLLADVAAPLILVPSNRTDDTCPCLALSLGQLHVDGKFEPVDVPGSVRLQECSTAQHPLTEFRDDVTITETIAADVTGMQLVLATLGTTGVIDDWLKKLDADDDTGRLLRRVNFKVNLQLGSQPVQRVLADCDLSRFSMAVSRSQIAELLVIKQSLSLTNPKEAPATPNSDLELTDLEPEPELDAEFKETSDSPQLEASSESTTPVALVEFSRALTFKCEEIAIDLLNDGEMGHLAKVSICKLRTSVAMSRSIVKCAFFLQGLEISGETDANEKLYLLGSSSSKVMAAEGAADDEQISDNHLVTIFFDQQPGQRNVAFEMQNLVLTFDPTLVRQINERFVQNLGNTQSGSDESHLRRIFQEADGDASTMCIATNDTARWAAVSEQLGFDIGDVDLFEMDYDNSGEIDFVEFSKWMKVKKAKQLAAYASSYYSSKRSTAPGQRLSHEASAAATQVGSSTEPFKLHATVRVLETSVQLAWHGISTFRMKMTQACVDYDANAVTGRKSAKLELQNFTMHDIEARHYGEMVGVLSVHDLFRQSSVSNLNDLTMVTINWDKFSEQEPDHSPESNAGRPVASRTSIKTCPLKVALSQESQKRLLSYIERAKNEMGVTEETLAAASEMAAEAAERAKAAAKDAAQQVVATRNIVTVNMNRPNFIYLTTLGSLSNLRITPTEIEIKSDGDAIAVQLTEKVDCTVVADYGGMSMEMFKLRVDFLNPAQPMRSGDSRGFLLYSQTKTGGASVAGMMDINGKFWDMRLDNKWKTFLKLKTMQLQVSQQTINERFSRWNVSFDYAAVDESTYSRRDSLAAELNVSGSLLYAATQYNNCRTVDSAPISDSVRPPDSLEPEPEAEPPPEGVPPGDPPSRATIVNNCGVVVSWLCTVGKRASADALWSTLHQGLTANFEAQTANNTNPDECPYLHIKVDDCAQACSPIVLTQACSQAKVHPWHDIHDVTFGDGTTASVYIGARVKRGVLIVTVQSLFSIYNETDMLLDAKVLHGRDSEAPPIQLREHSGCAVAQVNSQGWLSLKADVTGQAAGHISVRYSRFSDLRLRRSGDENPWSETPLQVDESDERSPALRRTFSVDVSGTHLRAEIVTMGRLRRVTLSRPLQVVNLLPIPIKIQISRRLEDGHTESSDDIHLTAGGPNACSRADLTRLSTRDQFKISIEPQGGGSIGANICQGRHEFNINCGGGTQEFVLERRSADSTFPHKLKIKFSLVLNASHDEVRIVRISVPFWVVSTVQHLDCCNPEKRKVISLGLQSSAQSKAWSRFWHNGADVLDGETGQNNGLPPQAAGAIVMVPDSDKILVNFGKSTQVEFDCAVKNRGNNGLETLRIAQRTDGFASNCVKYPEQWYVRGVVQYGPGPLEGTKILTITPWFAIRNTLAVPILFRAKAAQAFVPARIIPPGAVVHVHPQLATGADEEWGQRVSKRLQPCTPQSQSHWGHKLLKAIRSTLVTLDNTTDYPLELTAKRVRGTWGDSDKSFRDYWEPRGIRNGPPPRIRPNERVVFGVSSTLLVGDAEGRFEYKIAGDSQQEGKIGGEFSNPFIDGSKGKWCRCHASGRLSIKVEGGRPTQESNNKVDFIIETVVDDNAEALAASKLNCELAAEGYDWSTPSFSLEEARATPVTIVGLPGGSGEDVMCDVARGGELAEFVATIRRPLESELSTASTTKADFLTGWENQGEEEEVTGDVVVVRHRGHAESFIEVEVQSGTPLPPNPEFTFTPYLDVDDTWDVDAKTNMAARYIESIHCCATLNNDDSFKLTVSWKRWEPWEVFTSADRSAYKLNVKWMARSQTGEASHTQISLSIPDFRLSFAELDHEESIFSGARVENDALCRQKDDEAAMEITVFDISMQLSSESGTRIRASDFQLVSKTVGAWDSTGASPLAQRLPSATITTKPLDADFQAGREREPFLSFFSSGSKHRHGAPDLVDLAVVRVGRKLKLNVTDEFLLKVMELANNMIRYSGQDTNVTSKFEVATPSFLNSKLNATSCSSEVHTDVADEEPDAGHKVFGSVKISGLEIDVEFERVTTRAEALFTKHLFQGFKTKLPLLRVAGSNFLGVSGNANTVVKLVQEGTVKEVTRNLLSHKAALITGAGKDLALNKANELIKDTFESRTGIGSKWHARFDELCEETGEPSFVFEKMDRKGLIMKHSRTMVSVASPQKVWQQAVHVAFDWTGNHAGVNARSCAVLAVVNRSSVPVDILSAEGKIPGLKEGGLKAGLFGALGDLGTATGLSEYGCEVTNKQLAGGGKGAWVGGKASLIFGYGTRLAEIEVTVSSTAFDCHVGGPSGSIQTVQPKQGFHCVWERVELGGLWNIWMLTVLDHDTIKDCGGIAEVYENERRIAVFGIGGDFKAKDLMKSDRSQWSSTNEKGTIRNYGHLCTLESIEPLLLPRGAEWGDDSGAVPWEPSEWEYAFNFGLKPLSDEWYKWTSHAASTDSVRRRKWTRKYKMVARGSQATVQEGTDNDPEADSGQLDPTLFIQLPQRPDFVRMQASLDGSSLSLVEETSGGALPNPPLIADVTRCTVGPPKSTRAGYEHTFRLDLASSDNSGHSKYICAALTAAAKEKWEIALERAASSVALSGATASTVAELCVGDAVEIFSRSNNNAWVAAQISEIDTAGADPSQYVVRVSYMSLDGQQMSKKLLAQDVRKPENEGAVNQSGGAAKSPSEVAQDVQQQPEQLRFPRIQPTRVQRDGLIKDLRKATRSCLIEIDNRTNHMLRMHSPNLISGSWAREPPSVIKPNELVVFGNKSKFMWEAEGQLHYRTEATADGEIGEVYVHWKIPLVTDAERGNWSHIGANGSCKLGIEGGNGPMQMGEAPFRGSPTQEDNARVRYVVYPA